MNNIHIPDYNLIGKCGRGAYGDVWLAEDISGRCVAVKIIDKTIPFERELSGLRACRDLQIPGLIRIMHIGETPDFFYYTMELADSLDEEHYTPATLTNIMMREEKLSAARVLELAGQILPALCAMHRKNLIHRDIKPENIIRVNGKFKLSDIGLMRSTVQTLTLAGTLGFIPPERLIESSGGQTTQDDLYALGKVLYCAWTGNSAAQFPAVPAELTGAEEDRHLNRLLRDACSRNPNRRFASAEKFLVALSSKDESLSRRKIFAAAGIAALITLIAAGGGAFIYKSSEPVPEKMIEEKADKKPVEPVKSSAEPVKSSAEPVKSSAELQSAKQLLKNLHEKAAAGDPEAMLELGMAYTFHKHGVVRNYNKAFKMFKQSAEKGNVRAGYFLACCYYYGRGCPKNDDKAMELFAETAEKGNRYSQYVLAERYDKGTAPGGRNLQKAIKWYTLSAEQGHMTAKYNLACCLQEEFDELENFENTPEGRAMDKKTAARHNNKKKELAEKIAFWHESAARQGKTEAMLAYGNCCVDGLGVPENHAEAFKWWKKAADRKNSEALFVLGRAYYEGIGVKQNAAAGAERIKLAATQGYVPALNAFGWCLEHGDIGDQPNRKMAVHWYSSCAEKGFAPAQYNMGITYLKGDLLPPDLGEAEKWLKLSARQGYEPALKFWKDNRLQEFGCRTDGQWHTLNTESSDARQDRVLGKLRNNASLKRIRW